jgi:hypothetical protein
MALRPKFEFGVENAGAQALTSANLMGSWSRGYDSVQNREANNISVLLGAAGVGCKVFAVMPSSSCSQNESRYTAAVTRNEVSPYIATT